MNAPPAVLSEDATLDACVLSSIARFGDGELRLAIGGGCSSQRDDPRLAAELVGILTQPTPNLLVGIPNFAKTPRRDVWDRYRAGRFAELYRLPLYGSSFITRPDNAPWIDRPDYWENVRRLWRNRDVVLVTGDRKSITPEELRRTGAGRVLTVEGPRQHAYAIIDALELEIRTRAAGGDLVILCLGAAATVLAARLARRGIHALDLGHMGMFMKHAGAYQFSPKDLASSGYKDQLQRKHRIMNWGSSGKGHAPEVLKFADELGATSVLDYGCGRGTLKPALPALKVFEYDPGIPGKDHLPKPADLIVSTDVLEHIEPALVDNVLRHIHALARRGAYLVISLRLARETLPDGRNAHLSVHPQEWWLERIRATGEWAEIKTEMRKGLCVWLKKSTDG